MVNYIIIAEECGYILKNGTETVKFQNYLKDKGIPYDVYGSINDKGTAESCIDAIEGRESVL